MPNTIPSELWLQIASVCSKRDLNRLSLTCSEFSKLLRPMLYRHVSLREDGENFWALRLLIKNADLAAKVRTFNCSGQRVDFEMLFTAIRSMKKLDSLRFTIDVPHKELQAFVDHLNDREQPILKLCFHDLYLTGLYGRGVSLAFKRLEEVELNASTYHPSLIYNYSIKAALADDRIILGVLQASLGTLTRVSLPSEWSFQPRENRDKSDDFWSLRFPRLQRLFFHEFGVRCINSLPDIRKSFFLAHMETLQVIDFGSESDRIHGSIHLCLPTEARRLAGDKLAIQRITMSSTQLRRMLRLNAQETKFTLQQVEIRDYSMDNRGREEMEQCKMLLTSYLATARPFKAIQELKFNLFSEYHTTRDWMESDIESLYQIIQRTSNLFGPTVERWTGCLPPLDGLKPEALGRVLQSHPKLRYVRVSPPADFTGTREDFASSLAGACLTLEAVEVVHQKTYGMLYYKVVRDGDRKVTRVLEA